VVMSRLDNFIFLFYCTGHFERKVSEHFENEDDFGLR
jgi:hypothetical protein